MIRFACIVIFSFLSLSTFSQTFHLIIDPVEGDETDFHNNFVVDLAVTGDKIILSGEHACDQLPESSNLISCASLSIFDLVGNFNESILIDTFFASTPGGLLTVGNRIFTANLKQKDPIIGRSLYIQEYNQSLDLIDQKIIPNRPDNITNNRV